MSKQFTKGNRYVFIAKKCKKDLRNIDRRWSGENEVWAKELNGRKVSVISFGNLGRGYINTKHGHGTYGVFPEWCKCIGKEV